MATTYIPTYSDLGNECERSCENCRFWGTANSMPIYADLAGRTVSVRQCMAGDESASSPMVDGISGNAVIFTPPGSGCDCFEADPELAAECLTEQATHNSLNRELNIAAWA